MIHEFSVWTCAFYGSKVGESGHERTRSWKAISIFPYNLWHDITIRHIYSQLPNVCGWRLSITAIHTVKYSQDLFVNLRKKIQMALSCPLSLTPTRQTFIAFLFTEPINKFCSFKIAVNEKVTGERRPQERCQQAELVQTAFSGNKFRICKMLSRARDREWKSEKTEFIGTHVLSAQQQQ